MFDQIFRRNPSSSEELLSTDPVPALPAAPVDAAPPVEAQTANIIAADTRISGPITTCGTMKIAGVIEGRVGAGDSLTIELGGQVLGGIEGTNVTVRGVVRGDVVVTGRLTIASTGRVFGDVVAGAVVVDDGGVLEGRCAMGDGPAKGAARRAEADFLSRMIDDDDATPVGLAPALA